MKISKKLRVLALGMIMALSFGSLVGCSSKDDKPASEPAKQEDSKDKKEVAYEDIDGEKALKLMEKEKDGIVIDVRDDKEYSSGHIANAININVDDIEGKLSGLDAYKDNTVILYCNSGKKSAKAADILVKNGFTKVYNAQGVKDFDYDLVTYNDITGADLEKAIADNKDAVLVDVRKADEFAKGHIENAINIPLEDIESKLDTLDKEKDIYLYCRTGNRSGQAAKILSDKGYTKVSNSIDGVDEHEFKLVK
ncbi:MAG: rhodanese-like domain-containing protein [Clostridioides difficile]|nr:rhodanese-like domain-containing protein [Clostridioides sp.]MBS5787130.1 rhodanese-like domain-containing protein [Clostridioides difficile]